MLIQPPLMDVFRWARCTGKRRDVAGEGCLWGARVGLWPIGRWGVYVGTPVCGRATVWRESLTTAALLLTLPVHIFHNSNPALIRGFL